MSQRSGFIVSTGRTGTSFLTYLINNYVDNAYSETEPKPAFRRRGLRILSREPYWHEKIYFKSFRAYRDLFHDEKWYIETNHKLFSLVPHLRQWYSEALIIHVIRDGREVVRSWINYGRFMKVKSKTLKLLPNLAEDDSIRQRWKNWNPIQRAAWYWSRKATVIDSSNPDYTFRFSNLLNAEGTTIFEFLDKFEGVDYQDREIKQNLKRKKNESTSNFIPEYSLWPDHWKEQFWELAGNAMERFSYG